MNHRLGRLLARIRRRTAIAAPPHVGLLREAVAAASDDRRASAFRETAARDELVRAIDRAAANGDDDLARDARAAMASLYPTTHAGADRETESALRRSR
ncbi:hypothetical protein ACNS7O_10185 [Haloferacaceae archaeon DSL9]